MNILDRAVITTVSMPLSLFQKVREQAKQNHETISEFVRWAIIKELQITNKSNGDLGADHERTLR